MKKYIFLALILLLSTQNAFAGWVNGYYRSNGTYVQGYYRSDANNTTYDNYSYTTPTYTTPTYSYSTPTYSYSTPVSCTDTYGFGAKDNYDGTCSCRTGYKFEYDSFLQKKQCKSFSCFEYGLYAEMDYANNSCKCKDGYKVKTDSFGNQSCEKKAYSSYAIIKEVKGDEAIVVYLSPGGSLEYKKITTYFCNGISDYIGDSKSVVNLMDDDYLNSGDYLVLPDKTSCNLSFVEYADDSTTLTTKTPAVSSFVSKCGKNSFGINGKCSCLQGYVWEFPSIENNYDCKPNTTIQTATVPTTTSGVCKKGELKRKGKCVSTTSLK